ncbi:MAG: hypothetical protein MJZ52_06835 [Bacteroidales bacterium]|nr:hypothetical protein [Bacteroidales bacterium]
MKKIVKIQRNCLLVVVVLASAILFSCQNNPKQPMGLENMPEFEQKFPQKSIWVHQGQNDSTELTFSSMEEAEWKLQKAKPDYDDFVRFLSSVPESMDYPFDSLFRNGSFCGLCSPEVKSNDGKMRCFREYPPSGHAVPRMIVQYRIKDGVRVAEEGFPSDNCYYCLAPDTVFSFSIGESTLYLVSGYIGYTGHGHCYGLMAYELDAKDFHPAFVFHTDTTCVDYLWEQHTLNIEICFNADTVSRKDLFYFDKNKSTIYVREIANKEMVEKCGCITKITDRYWKYVWNGKEFVESGFVHKK